jgi:hypothetical protein
MNFPGARSLTLRPYCFWKPRYDKASNWKTSPNQLKINSQTTVVRHDSIGDTQPGQPERQQRPNGCDKISNLFPDQHSSLPFWSEKVAL